MIGLEWLRPMQDIWEEIEGDCESGARRLVAEYGDRLYAAALFLCPNAADAEELVFRTFERAVSRIGQFKPGGEFYGWLYVIMLNFRRMDLRRNLPDVVSVGTTSDLPEVADTSLVDVLSGVDAEAVRGAMRRIPYGLAEVLVLRFFEGWSMEEMAEILEIPVGTVKSRLHHAKAAFRTAFLDATTGFAEVDHDR